MANKQNFSPDEWTKVLESVILASLAITASEPSGVWGTLMETFAGGSALAASKVDPGSNELVKAVISDFEINARTILCSGGIAQGLGGCQASRGCPAFTRQFAGGLRNPQCQSTRRCRGV